MYRVSEAPKYNPLIACAAHSQRRCGQIMNITWRGAYNYQPLNGFARGVEFGLPKGVNAFCIKVCMKHHHQREALLRIVSFRREAIFNRWWNAVLIKYSPVIYREEHGTRALAERLRLDSGLC